MVAALKFFLGQDEAADHESDDEGDEDELKAVQPSKQEMYNANKKVSTAADVAHMKYVQKITRTTNSYCRQAEVRLYVLVLPYVFPCA